MSTDYTKAKAKLLERDALGSACTDCKKGAGVPIELAFPFQPIVDIAGRRAYAQEALVRGPNGESAASVLAQVDKTNRYQFDQRCRATAITQASALELDGLLSINFMPNAVYRPEACIRNTLKAAEKYGFPIERIIFETIEGENIISRPHLVNIFQVYKRFDFQTAIDDFGAGYSGLALLADFQPDLIKLDMGLVRGIDTDFVRQRIVCGVLAMGRDIGVRVIAEGIETRGERDFFAANDVTLMQGYLLLCEAYVQGDSRC